MDLGISGLIEAEPIGSGGFATVYRARQLYPIVRTVAVKVMHIHGADAPSKLAFQRECTAMGLLADHPNIVTVHDAGITDAGAPYIVLAYLPNGSLQDALDGGKRFGFEEVLDIGIKLSGALESAHRLGVVHRDIKPANVLRSGFGEVMLADFGIARVEGSTNRSTTVSAFTPAHGPPEAYDHPVGRAGDVYSLASTLYTLLAGRSPFESSSNASPQAFMKRVLMDPPPDLRSNGVPEPLWHVLATGLEKVPSQRHSSAARLGEALQEAQGSLGLQRSPMPVAELGSRHAAGVNKYPGAFESSPYSGPTVGGQGGPAFVPETNASLRGAAAGRGWRARFALIACLTAVVLGAVTVARNGLPDRGESELVGVAIVTNESARPLEEDRSPSPDIRTTTSPQIEPLVTSDPLVRPEPRSESAEPARSPLDGSPAPTAPVSQTPSETGASNAVTSVNAPDANVLAAGRDHTCALMQNGSATCWGEFGFAAANAPEGQFRSLTAGDAFTCGVRFDNSVECWGGIAPVTGAFSSLRAGFDHVCGIRAPDAFPSDDGTVACFRSTAGSITAAVPEGPHIAITGGDLQSCALRPDGTAVCWGDDRFADPTPPRGQFVHITTGDLHSCGIRPMGQVDCWGGDHHGQSTPPVGVFNFLAAGKDHTCGIRDDRTVLCWGSNEHGQALPPDGEFLELAGARTHTCGLRVDKMIVCWGSDSGGKSSPPEGAFGPD